MTNAAPPSSSSASSATATAGVAAGVTVGLDILLRNLINQYLSLYIYDTAKFYAERLHSECPSQDNLHLLAQCYYRQGKIKQTYLILQQSTSNSNRYLFALSCIALKKYSEAERTLLPVAFGQPHTMTNEQYQRIPGGATGIYLLGSICRKEHRKDSAIKYFQKSLEYDSSLWCSIIELSELGVYHDLSALYGVNFPTAVNILSQSSTSKGSSSSSSSGINKNINYNCMNIHSTADAVAADRQHIISLENKHLAESVSKVHGTPNIAMSLGLSSSSFRAPFVSPGSMPHNHDMMVPTDGRSNNMRSTMMMNMSSSTVNSSSAGPPRVALFGAGTPGMTPISLTRDDIMDPNHLDGINSVASTIHNATNVNQLMMSMSSDGDHHLSSIGRDSTNDVELFPGNSKGNITMNDSDSDNSRHILGGIDQTANYTISNTITNTTNKAFHRSSNTLPGSSSEPNRRVSFRPPSRLSFSGIGMDYDLDNDHDYDNNFTDFDEHPLKVQRMGNQSPSSYNAYFNNMSPINTTSATPGHDNVYLIAENVALGNSANRSSNNHENVDPNCNSQDNNNSNTTNTTHIDGHIQLAALLTVIGTAYQFMCSYQCRKCVQVLHKLPQQHFSSGFVQQLIGKAYCEMNEYKAALLALREMLRLEPFRVTGTDVLSTALWHLKKDKELCSLAQQIVEVDKFAPETWCVLGNCFSLQREPDAAIRFFQRALQVDCYFPYAHTLCGHEYVNNEDLDKAISSFRNALLLDDRHYNAWYGLGSIYYRQEKYELAEYHFRRALSINTSSSVLQCYLAMVLHAQKIHGKSLEAVDVLIKACSSDTKNPQLHFQLAHIFVYLDRYEEAIVQMNIVQDQAPKEPMVYVLLGQIYQKLGLKHEAIRNLNIAVDLDPKEIVTLKSLLDQLEI